MRTRRISATSEDLQWLRNAVDKSVFPQAEIHLTEWSHSPGSRDHTHDYLQAAAFIVKTNLDSTGLVDSLAYWTFTDVFEERGGGDTPFHGGFGLINFQGIIKPAFQAYRFLNRLGDEELHREDGMIVTRNSRQGTMSGLFYNYPDEVPRTIAESHPGRENAEHILAAGSAKSLSLTIENLEPGSSFVIETLDQEHGFALRTCQRMGQPNPPSLEQTRLLRQAGFETRKEFIHLDHTGKLSLELTLEPWSVVSLRQID